MTNMTVRMLLLFALPFIAGSAAGADRVKRPMFIHQLTQLGLEIWTEKDPEWETRLEFQHGTPVFLAETPALTYPPAGMSWVSLPGMKFNADEILAAAHGAIHQVALNYGVRDLQGIVLQQRRYGALSGYEATFSSSTQDVPVDVRVFCGHQPGKPAVLMQAFTLREKLEHLSEHVRRSWTHLRYLN